MNLDKDQIQGILGTLIFHAVLIAALALGYLYYRYPPEEHPELDNSEILFGGEFVEYDDFGDMNTPALQESAPAPNQVQNTIEGSDVVDEGVKGDDVPPLVSSTDESPMKEVKKENPGPTQEELAEQQRIREQEETSKRVSKSVVGAFGKSANSQKQTAAKEETKETTNGGGNVSIEGLDGYSLSSFGDVGRTTKQGWIKVQVTVNDKGEVIGAKVSGGDGVAYTDLTLRKKYTCITNEI